MSKYDSVDRLMEMATEKAAPAKSLHPQPDTEQREAEAVLEQQMMATEAGVPEPKAELGRPRVTRMERGRQWMGALRPFLPVVGGALRMVDHGAVQAVARLLPLLGGVANGPGSVSGVPASGTAAAAQEHLTEMLSAFDKQQAAIAEELKTYKQRVTVVEDQLRRTRESLERTAGEQNAQSNSLRVLGDRSKLLTAGVVILLMLVITQMVLFVIFLHR